VGVIAVPNCSEGRDAWRVRQLTASVEGARAKVLDVHSDRDHNRSVLTVAGSDEEIVSAMAELACAARYVDLSRHTGVHPRLGGLDVCPIVPLYGDMDQAVTVALNAARAIADRANLPVYLYGEAAARCGNPRTLPSLRKGGLQRLIERSLRGFAPDFGPRTIDSRTGVVCVGARGVLIAFNVWLRCDPSVAYSIAASIRASAGGLPGVRALGLAVADPNVCQVSMNLTDPSATGMDDAFLAVASRATAQRAEVLATEIVGLVPERFMPDSEGQAARLLLRPGRSLESALDANC
jgi:glutamate formiminotransferase